MLSATAKPVLSAMARQRLRIADACVTPRTRRVDRSEATRTAAQAKDRSTLIVAIASGKGGTGKTTVATNLAAVSPVGTCYADCDVEEPNGHIFLNPSIYRKTLVTTPVPRVKTEVCDLCGLCSEACRFNAIAVHAKGVAIFDELCHGCGGCAIACPLDAIYEEPREIGVVEIGVSGDVHFVDGRLNIGEAVVPPLVNAVKREIPDKELVLIDAAPGTSCPVMAALDDVDYCVLVTEPTPFGLNDLTLAVEMVGKLGVPFGVVVNRDGVGDGETEAYCKSENISILMKIPNDRKIAEAYSRGSMIVDDFPEMRREFLNLLSNITSEVKDARRARLSTRTPQRKESAGDY